MAETLTESFCERCGTRYEFRAPTRLDPLRKTRGLLGGLKTYLTGQDSLSEAINDAMRTEQSAIAAAQLEAFHEAFNFCIDCRQYTCVSCWNDGAGRCQTCVPMVAIDAAAEGLAPAFGDGALSASADPSAAPALGAEAWPSADLPPAALPGPTAGAEAWPEADPLVASTSSEPEVAPDVLRADDGFVYDNPPVEAEAPEVAETPEAPSLLPWEVAAEAEPEPVVAGEPEAAPESVMAEAPEPVAAEFLEPEPVRAEEPEPIAVELEPEPEPVVADEPEPIVAAAEEPEPELTRPLLRVLSWESDAAYDVEPPVAEEPAPEPEPVVAPEPEPVVAPAPEQEPVAAEPEEEPIAASAAPEPETVPEPEPFIQPTPKPTIAPIGDTILRFPQRRTAPPQTMEPVAAEEDAPEVAARRAQLESIGLGDPGQGPVMPEPAAIQPYRSRGAAVPQGELAARAVAQGVSFWEASAREVAEAGAMVGVQNCGGCGLSLSASARFCRRCGTPQSRSA